MKLLHMMLVATVVPRSQFRKEEERARDRGEYSPPGLLNIDQFRHAFKKFSVKVSEEQAMAMFIKFGHDGQVSRAETCKRVQGRRAIRKVAPTP